jgi:hypothetical protein
MARKKETWLTVKEAAQATGAAENSIRVWLNDEKQKAKRFPNAKRVSTPRGDYWLIPASDVADYKNPGRGRPRKNGTTRKA